MTAQTYVGHVKRNPATNEVAVRSVFDENDPSLVGKAWLVIGPSRGARFASSTEVSGWNTLYTAPAPE